MPYSSNSDLPESVRSRYSSNCQSVWRHTWNSVYADYGDEQRAFASATGQANKCQGKKTMTGIRTATIEPTFKIFAPMLKASLDTDGKRRLHGIASSTIKDRHGDSMSLSALADMERSAAANLTIFLNHEYKVPEDVAGYVERAAIRQHPSDGDIHDLVLDIVVNESNPRAVNAWDAIQNGTQLGLSIGAMIPDGGATRDRKSGAYQIDHVELLETSLVGVPANPRSWVEYAVKSLNGVLDETTVTTHEDGSITQHTLVRGPEAIVDDRHEHDDGEVHDLDVIDATVFGDTNKTFLVGERGPEQVLVKAPMSSGHRNALPDSAFACPGSRKYPHHTSSGAVDKAHLRNALSRCGDKSNDQCGCAHVRAHAQKLGMGGSDKSFDELMVFALEDGIAEGHLEMTEAEEGPTFEWDWEAEDAEELEGAELAPYITDATVNIETPFANITVDTGNRGGTKPAPAGEASQEAQLSAPETEDQDETVSPYAGILPVQSALTEPDVKTALELLEPSVVASLRNSTEVLKAITRELIDTRTALDERNSEYAALEEMTKEVIANTGRILDKLSNTPTGRRAVIREVNEEFVSLKAVYGEDFLTLLKRS